MVQNPRLKFAVETLLKEANPAGEPYFKATHFHKMIYLFYERLKKKRIDIKLPYSWYHYGTYVDATEFERQVGVPFSYYVPDNGPTRAIGAVSTEGIPQSEVRIFGREANRLVNGFKRDDGWYMPDYLSMLLDKDYAYAPYKFQQLFNREFKMVLGQFKSYLASPEEIEACLDRLIKEYPYNQAFELYDAFLEWDDTMRLALKYSNASRVKELADKFWLIFTELTHVKKNENISADIVEPWSLAFFDKLDAYNWELDKERSELLRMSKIETCDQGTKQIVSKMNALAFQLATDDMVSKGV